MNEQLKLNERLDTQEQVLDQVVTKVEALEKRDYPDYTQATADLKEVARQLKANVAEIKTFIQALVKGIPVKHGLDLTNKWVIIGACIWFAVTAFQTGLNLCQHAEINSYAGQSLEYRAIRQVYPKQTDWADSLYRLNPDSLEQKTVLLEEQSVSSSHAQRIADQKAQEAAAAQANAKQLSDQSRLAHKKAAKN